MADLTFSTGGDALGPEYHGTISALDGDRVVGYLSYGYYLEEAHVKMVEVVEDRRRGGVATALLARLREELPDAEVTYSLATEDGAAFLAAVA